MLAEKAVCRVLGDQLTSMKTTAARTNRPRTRTEATEISLLSDSMSEAYSGRTNPVVILTDSGCGSRRRNFDEPSTGCQSH